MGDLLADNDSDGEIKFTINKSYASKYTAWRGKQVMRSLEDRLGDRTARRSGIQSEKEESSSEDDEDARDLPKVEKSFYQVLSLVKNKDPRIYDENLKFYPDITSMSNNDCVKTDSKKCKKDKPFVLRDYERKLILEKNGKLSDEEEEEEEEEDPRAASPTYVEEQKAIKDSFKQALRNSDEEEEDAEGFGSLLKKKRKSEAEQIREEEEYKEWLKGRQKELKDKTTESELKVLHDYWNDPKLDSDEVYLRDYILNKRYLEPEDEDFTPAHNEMVHDDCVLDSDMKYVNEQESFESKYNFRFEEPDPEFIKRYPRSVETSLRRKDDRRKIKRQEIRERKEAEMETKREEIKQLKALKKKEILEKIAKIKEITGNDDIDLKDEDLEDDFNPEKHDQKMQELFSDHYYEVVETEKPRCPELEQDLEIEDWENWRGKDEDDNNWQYNGYGEEESCEQPQSEDPNFIMDCDYDPRAQLQKEITNLSKSKKKQRRRSKFAQAIAKEKPVFDPNDKKFEEYFDEYYKLDCEDIIGDLPCRFKYRRTTPNDYGLSVDEILRADAKELNKWCSLKKIVRHKPENVEIYEVQAYKQKANNEALKRKILPSLYVSNSDQNEAGTTEETGKIGAGTTYEKNMKKQKKKKKRKLEDSQDDTMQKDSKKQKLVMNGTDTDSMQKKSKKKKRKEIKEENDMVFYKQKKIDVNSSDKGEIHDSCHFRKKSDNYMNQKKKKNNSVPDGGIPISDTRLKAYGIRPKKFKNKIKYGNKQNVWS